MNFKRISNSPTRDKLTVFVQGFNKLREHKKGIPTHASLAAFIC